MLKAIQHAKPYTRITQEELDIILHARKTLLFSRYKTWKKPINESLFDIAMESYDGAEICERVSLYILSILGKMVLRSASVSVCIYYLFLGKYMESKT